MIFRLLVLLCCCIYIKTSAQVPVSQEPYHPIAFENNKLRILNVKLPAGDTTQYHLHSTPSLFIFFTTTKTGSQLINKEPGTGTSAAGNILFENLDTPNTRTHRVWNMDTAVFHVMDIELLSPGTGFNIKPLSLPNVVLTIDTPWMRAYSIALQKSDRVSIRKSQSAFVLVALNNGMIVLEENRKKKRTSVKEGQFYWFKSRDKFSFKNDGITLLKFALVEVE